ncbi:MAG: hypothetical protein M3441_08050 [Chloroflexota bacterium]|nr:hypothetical protein [Chloroflexota bacterium]
MRGKQSVEMSLVREIKGLRASLRLARKQMKEEEDLVKIGPVVARLTDSVGRALVVQSKLAAGDGTSALQSEAERVLRELGLGEE